MKPETITTFLRAVFSPGDVFEIRVLDARYPNSSWAHTESGYFEYSQIDLVPNCLANFASYAGVYVTLNPVNPVLLARAHNRIIKVGRNSTTAEADIIKRNWLLVDVDPVRPAGISATDQEKSLAFDMACEIYKFLEAKNFAAPIVVDSGNGTQLLYKVDLPADSDLPKQILHSLENFSDGKVSVDQSVHNASRISRVPGTWNRKGDSIPDRPHRLAEIIDMPAEIKTTATENLQQLAEENVSSDSEIPEPNRNNFEPAEYFTDDSNPAADFNNRGEIKPVLAAHGWTLKSESDQQYWYRPGKATGQHSATFDGDVFFNFSGNAEHFEASKGYNKFQVYSILEHGGDETAAINSVRAEGFGADYSNVDISGIMQNFSASPEPILLPDLPDGNDFNLLSLTYLHKNFTGLNMPVIHGLLREGETMNFIGAPKTGKSWLALHLSICIAAGRSWHGFKVEPGWVLHIDNELHTNLLTSRYKTVAEALSISPNRFAGNIDILSLRSKLQDIDTLGAIFRRLDSINTN